MENQEEIINTEIDKLKAQLRRKNRRINKLETLLNKALRDINNLSKEKVKLESKLSEYVNLDNYKEYCKGHKFNDDILWITIQYPEYFGLKPFKRKDRTH